MQNSIINVRCSERGMLFGKDGGDWSKMESEEDREVLPAVCPLAATSLVAAGVSSAPRSGGSFQLFMLCDSGRSGEPRTRGHPVSGRELSPKDAALLDRQ